MCITPTKAKKAETRNCRIQQIGSARVLWITSGKLTVAYNLVSLAADFGKAFRLEKADNGNGNPESYDVLLAKYGFDSCECLGWLKHQKCKHRDCCAALVKLGRI
jgi:hypothetical protein